MISFRKNEDDLETEQIVFQLHFIFFRITKNVEMAYIFNNNKCKISKFLYSRIYLTSVYCQ